MTPDELHRMMIDLVRERDEIRQALESWGEIDASAGVATVSDEIRDRVERLRAMMRQASHLIDGIDEVAKFFPAGVSDHLDAQRALVLADRQPLLDMWSELAGMAERLNETLVALARADGGS